MRKTLLTVIMLSLAFVCTARAGANYHHKIAVHVVPHGVTCKSLPTFTDCSEMLTTYAGTGDIDVIPVFFDLNEYYVVEFGLSWPVEWGSMEYSRCAGDLPVGSIVNSGDGIATAWIECQQTWSVTHGCGWLNATGPGRISPIANPATGDYGTVDCAPPETRDYDYPHAVFGAGVGGIFGNDPCETVFRPLSLAKTDGLAGECLYTGDSLSYTISYDNLPNTADVHDVTLTDHLPLETVFLWASEDGAYDGPTHAVTWSLGTLAAGEDGTRELLVGVNADDGATLVNTCRIMGDEAPEAQSSLQTQVCRIDSLPLDISITDGREGACVSRLDSLILTISYGNLRNLVDAHNVILTAHLSGLAYFISASGDGVYDHTARTVTWSLGTLVPGSTGSVEIITWAAGDYGDQLVNECDIVSDENPLDEASQTTTVCDETPLPPTLEKSDGWYDSCPTCCRYPGDTVAYQITYAGRLGSTDLHDVTITDYLPSELDFVSASGGGAYDAEAHKVTWNIGTLPHWQRGRRDLTVRVVGPRGNTFINTCEITSSETSAVTASDRSRVCSDPLSPLGISKSATTSFGCVNYGDTIRYRLFYDNARNTVEAHNVVLTDLLPSGLAFLSASGGGDYDSVTHRVTWTLGSLAPGATGSTEVVGRVRSGPTSESADAVNWCSIRCDSTNQASAHAYTILCLTKAAVHVLQHDALRTCTYRFPPALDCEYIEFQTAASDVDVFPVFFDLRDYRAFEYGMDWPSSWGSMAFTSCSDITLGGITSPGDGIAQSWTGCKTGTSVAPGHGHLVADGAGQVRMVAHPLTGRIGFTTCAGDTFSIGSSFAAGIGGAMGEPPPCGGPQKTQPTTWGAIKAMFK